MCGSGPFVQLVDPSGALPIDVLLNLLALHLGEAYCTQGDLCPKGLRLYWSSLLAPC